mgnify:CR=1 FL=1
MILMDFSGITVANIHVGISQFGKPTEDIVRSMIMNSVRRLNTKFKKKYGEMIICIDNRHYWRRDEFEHYKYKRRVAKARSRETDDLDWNEIYGWVNKIVGELRENFPYIVIDAAGAEADDIIGSLVTEYEASEKILILSRDGDFKQLQSRNVHQYDPISDKVVKVENPRLYLSEHIIRGDAGDGIPNILSPVDTFYTGIKQKSVMTKWIANCIGENPKDFCDTPEMLARYYENEKLIDLRKGVPKELYNEIISVYTEGTEVKNDKIYTYLVKNKLANFMDVMSDFHNEPKQHETGIF